MFSAYIFWFADKGEPFFRDHPYAYKSVPVAQVPKIHIHNRFKKKTLVSATFDFGISARVDIIIEKILVYIETTKS